METVAVGYYGRINKKLTPGIGKTPFYEHVPEISQDRHQTLDNCGNAVDIIGYTVMCGN